MSKSKVTSSKGVAFINGGSHKMLSKGGAGPQTPGQTTAGGRGSGNGAKFMDGGSKHMLGHMTANPSAAGQTGKSMSNDGGKFAEGGKGHMCGHTGSQQARAR